MTDKFCKDCKHSVDDGNGPYKLKCSSLHNEVPTVNDAQYLVSGIEQPVVMAMRGQSCVALRARRDAATDVLVCGPAGKWFEAKE